MLGISCTFITLSYAYYCEYQLFKTSSETLETHRYPHKLDSRESTIAEKLDLMNTTSMELYFSSLHETTLKKGQVDLNLLHPTLQEIKNMPPQLPQSEWLLIYNATSGYRYNSKEPANTHCKGDKVTVMNSKFKDIFLHGDSHGYAWLGSMETVAASWCVNLWLNWRQGCGVFQTGYTPFPRIGGGKQEKIKSAIKKIINNCRESQENALSMFQKMGNSQSILLFASCSFGFDPPLFIFDPPVDVVALKSVYREKLAAFYATGATIVIVQDIPKWSG